MRPALLNAGLILLAGLYCGAALAKDPASAGPAAATPPEVRIPAALTEAEADALLAQLTDAQAR